jgi:hypothetical protein
MSPRVIPWVDAKPAVSLAAPDQDSALFRGSIKRKKGSRSFPFEQMLVLI